VGLIPLENAGRFLVPLERGDRFLSSWRTQKVQPGNASNAERPSRQFGPPFKGDERGAGESQAGNERSREDRRKESA